MYYNYFLICAKAFADTMASLALYLIPVALSLSVLYIETLSRTHKFPIISGWLFISLILYVILYCVLRIVWIVISFEYNIIFYLINFL